MATTDVFDIKTELVVFLRNQDILSVNTRGVTTSQDTGTFAADSTHTLAVNPTLVKNVRNVNVATVDLDFGTDYTVNYVTGVITFVSAQTGDYIIDYDQGASDRIFPNFPQANLKLAAFPRIAVDILGANTEEIELGAGTTKTTYLVTMVAYDKDQDNVEALIATIRGLLIANKKLFYYIPFITPGIMGPLIPSPFGENKVLQRNQDSTIKFVYEN